MGLNYDKQGIIFQIKEPSLYREGPSLWKRYSLWCL